MLTCCIGGWSDVKGHLRDDDMIITGFIAVIALVVILVQSVSAVRHAFYEFFLHFHISLIVLALVFLWMHLDGYPQQNLLLAAIVVWAFARLLRVVNFVKCNFGRGGTKAVVELLPGDAMRLSFTCARQWTVKPGQYMYVYIPSVGLWTSHPFSVAWSDVELPLASASTESDSVYEEKFPARLDPDPRGKQTVGALIRRRTGFTNSLYKKAEKAGAFDGAKVSLTAYIEGPFGKEICLDSYGHIVLFAGGVGITHQVPYVRHLVHGFNAGTVAARKISLVWVIRSPEHLEWIRPWMTQILSMEKRRDILTIKLFITRPKSAKEVHSPSATVQM